MAPVVECLLSKCKALRSISSNAKEGRGGRGNRYAGVLEIHLNCSGSFAGYFNMFSEEMEKIN
jgi:hypothetical protein